MRAWPAARELAPLVARVIMESLPVYAVMAVIDAQGYGLSRLGWGRCSD